MPRQRPEREVITKIRLFALRIDGVIQPATLEYNGTDMFTLVVPVPEGATQITLQFMKDELGDAWALALTGELPAVQAPTDETTNEPTNTPPL